jgi:hypothetical protein
LHIQKGALSLIYQTKRAEQLDKHRKKAMTININKLTAAEAEQLTVYAFNYNGDIVETTLYDHVMESADQTTSPRGVMTKLFIDELEDNTYSLRLWRGQQWVEIEQPFDSYEQAKTARFQHIFRDDYQRDDQRDTAFFYTREEAEAEIERRIAEQ